jgi:hypothetical protein
MKQSLISFTRGVVAFLAVVLVVTLALSPSAALRAADHGDGPAASNDPAADIGDMYLFLDPNDNSRVVMEMTARGFLVPSEASNMGIFDPSVAYRFVLETTGDPIPDGMITVTFSPRTSNTVPQTATITMVMGTTTVFSFTAPATNPSINATPPVRTITTDPTSGVSFCAGEVDDPFFFDIVGFNRFVASVLAGAPDPTQFNRARDSFAGYNTMSIALSIPKTLLTSTNNTLGMYGTTLRASRHFDPSLINVSTRGRVDVGANVLIGGFIISGASPKKVIVRGLGPSLAALGVSGTLANPLLNIYNSAGTILATNDNWQDTQAAEITASGHQPTNANESAVVITLNPGPYTAILSGVNGQAGVGLIEVYDLNAGTPGSIDFGQLTVVDRMATPAVNVALIPFAKKDAYNQATPQDDAAGLFANDIVATLTALGTNSTNIGILAGIAVTNGDYLRLNMSTANSGPGGGNNAGAGFPNGRRLADDVIDTLLFFIANQTPLGDNVNANDVPLHDTFPFFGDPQQPRANGVVDDNTRN